MFCKNCENEIKDGVKFCDKCGTKVKINILTDIKKDDEKTYDNSLNDKDERLMVDTLKKLLNEKKITVSCLKEFGIYLENGQIIPQLLPDEPEQLLEVKDILKATVIGIIITAIIAPLSGIKVTFLDFMESVLFFSVILGGVTYYKKEKEYDNRKEKIAKKREEMLNGKNISKYGLEDEILCSINKNYTHYIGNTIFNSISIRDINKDLFQSEIKSILKFAEENHMNDLDLTTVIEKFYKYKFECGTAKFQSEINALKDRVIEFKAKFEDFEDESYINDIKKVLESIMLLSDNNFSLPLNRYESVLADLKKEMEKIEKGIQNKEIQRENEIESLKNNIPMYQKELAAISLRRKKYPDKDLSGSFIKNYKLKRCEVEEKLHLPIESLKNKASEIEHEIKYDIEALNNMIEAEYDSRHNRIYGKPENKLAAKFKTIHK